MSKVDDIEEAIPTNNLSEDKPPLDKKSPKKLFYGIGVLLVVGIVVALSVTLPSKGKDPAVNNNELSTLPPPVVEVLNETSTDKDTDKDTYNLTSLDINDEEEEIETPHLEPPVEEGEDVQEIVNDENSPLTPEVSATFREKRFSVALSDFDESILSGYPLCDDLIHDVEEALKDLANEIILKEASHDDYFYAMPVAMEMTTAEFAADDAAESDASGSSEKSGEDSFGTNNQVEGVDEADIVKSDGTHVFTVYGSDIVTLDTQGNELSRLSLNVKPKPEPIDVEPEPEVLVTTGKKEGEWSYGNDPSGAYASGGVPPKNKDQGNRRTSDWYPHDYLRVNGLLMHGDRLIAIVSRSGMMYYHMSYADSSAIEVVVMDIGADGNLTIVERSRVKGSYQAARAIGQNAHLVTSSWVDTWEFSYSLRRWRYEYDGLSDEEYITTAFEVAEANIPKVAEQLVRDLLSVDKSGEYSPDSCQHIARISSYKYGRDLNSNELSENSDPTGGSGSLNGFVRIMSFDMSSSPGEVLSNAHLTGSFVPTSYADVYASQDKLFLGGRGYRWEVVPFMTAAADGDASDEEVNIWRDYTYVTAFDLNGASASPLATGILPGYTLNQFSFDFHNDHLRVATSTSANRRWNHENGSFDVFAESTNQVLVSEIKDGSINIVGELTGLGLTERVYAVRFLGDRGFVVTFQQIDPFYTLDLTDPTKPTMMGELKIPGFSNYLHPVDDDYILAIGQDADEMGRTTGLQVALFDVSDMSNPEQIAKYVVEGSSYSSAQYDHYAFRYLPVSRKLIIPLSWYDWDPVTGRYSSDSFDGFHVYNIDPLAEEIVDANEKSEKITLDFEVSHYREEESRYCYGMANLRPRSLVFAGDLMTMKSHSVNVNTLSNKAFINAMNLDENRNATECAGWWYY